MTFDFEHHLGAVERSVSQLEVDGQPARSITLARAYDTSVDDLWDAVTNPERLPRWFLPVSGDLRPGGSYQLDGNAGGQITRCEAPEHLSLTWEIGGDVSWVEVRLTAAGADRARLQLTHTALHSSHWDTYGSGATGIGWELSLAGLSLHIADPNGAKVDEAALAASAEGKAFVRGSSTHWSEASVAAGENAEDAVAAAAKTTAFYLGDAG